MKIIKLIINKAKRLPEKKELIVVALLVVPLVIVASVMMSNRTETKSKIALVEQGRPITDNEYFDIIKLSETPKKSELVLGNYDFIVQGNGHGNYVVDTVIKSHENKQSVEDYFNKGILPTSYGSDEALRGIGTKTLGIMIMVLIMQAVALTAFYTEDRESRVLRRILTAPVTENEYIIAQIIFTFVFLYVPTYTAMVVAKGGFKLDIGFDYVTLAMLIGIITLLSTSFAVFISSAIKKNISLVASTLSILTSIVSGCLMGFTSKISVINSATALLEYYGVKVQPFRKNSAPLSA